ncbi:PIN domain-containing protein [Aquabacterium sp.]|uniref:PIN domain-containing protein n=1 Tax=Aquabacterium sp. TaxID=1872578 RepID=UPI002C78A02F|nr:PIN domain-containing protein [Aquabacterium sp.]HSW09119.1 PIN domain-containing protein [Aquabacterium sp.]
MRLALDTNVLVYAEGWGDADRCRTARHWLSRLTVEQVVIPAQALGELHRVLTGKAKRAPAEVRTALLAWGDAFAIADSTWPAFQAAMDLNTDHQLPIWDALILAVAAEHKCRALLSEDFQAGFTWRGVTVVNPFETPVHPLLARLSES